MRKGFLLFAASGLVGGVLGALIVRALEPGHGPPRSAPERPTQVAAPPDPALDRRLADVERRLADIERASPSAGSQAPVGAAGPSPTATRREGDGEGAGEGASPTPEAGAEFKDLSKWLKGRKIGPDEWGALFQWLTRNRERTAETIATILKEIETDPQNPELRVALAAAYVADLTNNTIPGPQQGIVWGKAAEAYDAALAIDGEHWMARYGKAFGTSMIPEFLGQRPEAIRQFEGLLEVQKRKPPEPHFATTYFRLGTLYKDAGNMDKARETWSSGIALFPDNEELKAALETSTKR